MSTIMITGASGNVGRAVLQEMRNSGQPIRAMYRTADDARNAPPDVATAIADFASLKALKNALNDVNVLFLVCSPIPQLVELESNVIEACQESAVKHIVLNSALGAGDYSKSFPSWHRKVEDKLKASGIAYTIFRPNGFMQNILAYNAPAIRAQGAFFSSMGDTKISLIDARDVAAAIANVLVAPDRHVGQTYELNGSEAVSNAEIAARISRVANREVKYIDIPESAQRQALQDSGMPSWQVDALIELQQYYITGSGAHVTDVLPDLLRRPARKLDQFLEESKDEFQPLNPKTGMTFTEMKQFVRNHFEEFVNRQNLDIVDVNFAPDFADHGADVPPGTIPGPAGAKQYVGAAYKKFPDIHVEILDLIAEDDRVVVRNRWTGTEASSGTKFEFSGIVIWRVTHRQLAERWAYLTPPSRV